MQGNCQINPRIEKKLPSGFNVGGTGSITVKDRTYPVYRGCKKNNAVPACVVVEEAELERLDNKTQKLIRHTASDWVRKSI